MAFALSATPSQAQDYDGEGWLDRPSRTTMELNEPLSAELIFMRWKHCPNPSPYTFHQIGQIKLQIMTVGLSNTERSKYLRYDMALQATPPMPSHTLLPSRFVLCTPLNYFVILSISSDPLADESLRIQIGKACQTFWCSNRTKRIDFGIQWRRARCPHGHISENPCAPSSSRPTLRAYEGASEKSLLISSQEIVP